MAGREQRLRGRGGLISAPGAVPDHDRSAFQLGFGLRFDFFARAGAGGSATRSIETRAPEVNR